MATCAVALDLDAIDSHVIDMYQKLMKSSVGQDSVYIKAKETIVQILEDANITGDQKGQILSQVIGSMVSTVTAQALGGAADLAKYGREMPYQLAKICAEIELIGVQKEVALLEKEKVAAEVLRIQAETNKTLAEIELVNAQKDAIIVDKNLKTIQGWLAQAQMYRDYGMTLTGLNIANPLIGDGNFQVRGTKEAEARHIAANAYATYAGSWRQNGNVVPVVNTSGTMTAATADTSGLTYWQAQVAERQKQGFDDDHNYKVFKSAIDSWSVAFSAAGTDAGITIPTLISATAIDGMSK